MSKKILLTLSVLLIAATLVLLRPAKEANSAELLWQPAELDSRAPAGDDQPTSFNTYDLNSTLLESILDAAPPEFTSSDSEDNILTLPLPNGEFSRFQLFETSMMEPGLAAKFPGFRTYTAQGVDDPTLTARLSRTPRGIDAIIVKGSRMGIIAPASPGSADTLYIAYDQADVPQTQFQEPDMGLEQTMESALQDTRSGTYDTGSQLRVYRIAVTTTGEFYEFRGNNDVDVMAFIVSKINLLNAIFEHNLAARFVLVAENDQLLFADADSDPFTDVCDLGEAITLNGDAIQSTIDTTIGLNNYDVGHLFTYHSCGGVVGGNACTTDRAKGITGANTDLGILAHELGHQFSLPHTWSSCDPSVSGQFESIGAYEPGSGSTIMSYAGTCGVNDVADDRIMRFHAASYERFQKFVTEEAGATCGTVLNTDNTAPTVDGGLDLILPFDTPFTLNGSASDAEDSGLTYTWDEFDQAPSDGAALGSDVAPFFVPYEAQLVPSRTFPRIEALASGTQELGEFLPQSAVTMTFRLFAYDNHVGAGGIGYDEIQVKTVDATAGGAPVTPFAVTSHSADSTWVASATETIDWNVGNSDQAPINCTTVDIDFSADGLAYDTSLASNTPNDGSEDVIVPSGLFSQSGRVRVSCASHADHRFFALNDGNISLGIGSYTDCTNGVVSNLANAGTCTLREAVDNASANDTITFDPRITGGTIHLTEAITIAQPIMIDGGNHDISIDGNDATRLLRITSNNTTLRGLTLANGAAVSGGAIQLDTWKSLTLEGMTFHSNDALAGSGGALNWDGGIVTISNTLFTENSGGLGGALSTRQGTINIHSSTFDRNTSTIYSNSWGGAISMLGNGTINSYNSTFTNNLARQGGAIGVQTVWNGAQIAINVVNSTLHGNRSLNGVDQIYMFVDPAPGAVATSTLNISNSILGGSINANCGMTGNALIGLNRHNLVDDNSCDQNAVNNVTGFTHVAPLADNGGATPTMAIASNSPAKDAGDPAICAASPIDAVDQRGVLRDASCDIGAYEYNSAAPDVYITQSIAPANPEPGETLTLTIAYGNSGSADAITPTITLPVNANYLSNPSWTSDGHNIVLTGGTYSWQADTLQPGSSGTIAVTAISSGAAVFHSQAEINAAGDGNDANNRATAVVLSLSSTCSLIVSDSGNGSDGDFSSGKNTLDEALICAQSGDTVTFASDMTIVPPAALSVPAGVTIDGTGHDVVLDGGDSIRLFYINEADTAIKNVTLRDGNSAAGGAIHVSASGTLALTNVLFSSNHTSDLGGAVYNRGRVTAVGSTFEGNSATHGGAILNAGGTLLLDSSILANNEATGEGGGLHNGWASSAVTVTATTFRNNVAEMGAGIHSNESRLLVQDSQLIDNAANWGGGGIASRSAANTELIVTGSLFTGNSARYGGGITSEGVLTLSQSALLTNTTTAWGGGGLVVSNGHATVRNTTFSNNYTPDQGGAIIIDPNGTLSLNHVTIYNNTAGNVGGGLSNNGSLTVASSIIAGNHRSGAVADDCIAANQPISADFNLIETPGTCLFNGANDLTGVDPRLGTLSASGTHVPAIDSPTLDAVTSCTLPVDQTGTARGAACDIGAVEIDYGVAPIAVDDVGITAAGETLSVRAPGVLANDSDGDNDMLTASITAHPQYGTVTLNADGSYDYTPLAGYNGVDSFDYIVSDGMLTDTGSVSVYVLLDTTQPLDVALAFAGWNLFAYPVQQTRTVTDALASIAGDYVSIFEYDAANDRWLMFDPTLTAEFSFMNTLAEMQYARGYWINTTQPTTITFDGLTRSANMTVPSNNTFGTPPAVFYGYLPEGVAAGETIEASVNGVSCGSAVAQSAATGAVYGLLVPQSADCGEIGRRVEIKAGNQLIHTGEWSASAATNTSAQAVSAVSLSNTDASNSGSALLMLLAFLLTVVTLSLVKRRFGTLLLIVGLTVAFGWGTTRLVIAQVAPPVMPHILYGTVTIDDELAPAGTQLIITVSRSATETHSITTSVLSYSGTDGYFSVVLPADALGTAAYDGGIDGDNITFRSSHVDAFDQTLAFASGELTEINLTGVTNLAPLAQDDAASTDEDTAVTISVLDNDSDADGDLLTLVALGTPNSGTITTNGTTVTYSPTLNSNGVDVFTYTVSDGGITDSATVSVTVNPVNDAPVALNDSAETNADTAIIIDVLANDTDVEGDMLSIETVSSSADGATSVLAGGIEFTPTSGFSGYATFTYTVSDGSLSDEGFVTVLVAQASAAVSPAVATSLTITDSNNSQIELTIGAGAVDSETILVFNELDSPSGAPGAFQFGGLSFGIDAYIDAVLQSGFNFVEPITVTIQYEDADVANLLEDTLALYYYNAGSGTWETDGITFISRDTNVNTVVFTIAHLTDFAAFATPNTAPVAQDDAMTAMQNTPITDFAPGVLANDSDIDGQVLTAQLVSQPAEGVVFLAADGAYTYTPTLNFVGNDSFVYSVSDGMASVTGTVHIRVLPDSTTNVVIPIHAAGWNTFGWPVASRPITEGLLSISGVYTTVFGYDGTNPDDPWQMYDVTLPAPYDALLNDITELEFGKAYWIRVREATQITVSHWAGRSAETHLLNNRAAQMPPPPATFYGAVDAPAGASITAWIGGKLCGEATVAEGGVYGLQVKSAGESAECGVEGAVVTLQLDDQLVATARWSSSGTAELPLAQSGVTAVQLTTLQSHIAISAIPLFILLLLTATTAIAVRHRTLFKLRTKGL